MSVDSLISPSSYQNNDELFVDESALSQIILQWKSQCKSDNQYSDKEVEVQSESSIISESKSAIDAIPAPEQIEGMFYSPFVTFDETQVLNVYKQKTIKLKVSEPETTQVIAPNQFIVAGVFKSWKNRFSLLFNSKRGVTSSAKNNRKKYLSADPPRPTQPIDVKRKYMAHNSQPPKTQVIAPKARKGP
jgi:hypothetical protein